MHWHFLSVLPWHEVPFFAMETDMISYINTRCSYIPLKGLSFIDVHGADAQCIWNKMYLG
jgi:hypothetical protein